MMGSSWERRRLNFLRRYRWAFIHEYEDVDTPPPYLYPELQCDIAGVFNRDKEFSPAGQVELAERLLTESNTPPGRMAGPWTLDRMEFVSKNGGYVSGFEEVAEEYG
ncbi:hypothetical protein EDC04DRAFT_3138333 [Pisolithus marmoratus]|nr:hypothetical protein EDC04DRAFT_3138333 [Pisolithus marmoratus]